LFGVGKIKLSFMECIDDLQVQYVVSCWFNKYALFKTEKLRTELLSLTRAWTTREF